GVPVETIQAIAREFAAIFGADLKPYPGVPVEELSDSSLDEIPISIADAEACPRYSGIALTGVPTQPAPLWMQLRLGRLGLRPISGLVDLTNYVMAELGQPMHAFDAGKVGRIEVDWAKKGEKFQTLDGVERKLAGSDLMIQCGGKSVALAGVMGGLETEVTEETKTLLLESANFNATTIRKTAGRLALRSDASARFEKSLDPAHTILSIRRFINLARTIYPKMKLASRLSDCYPKPKAATSVIVSPQNVSRTIGRDVPVDEITRILEPLGFTATTKGENLTIGVPSFRATGDIGIEADVIEEIARYIGYNNIAPTMPQVSMRRFKPNALHELEKRTLDYFTSTHAFHEIYGYLWYNATWLSRLDIDPGNCLELENPAAEGLQHLRRHLMPGLLASVEKNRFYFPALSLMEMGSVFEPGKPDDREYRHAAMILAKRGKRAEAELYAQLQGAIQAWGWQLFAKPIAFTQAKPQHKWEHPQRTAAIAIDGAEFGRISLVVPELRRAMDEHLGAWSIAWAELRLSGLEEVGRGAEPLEVIPSYPLVELDFSILVTKSMPFETVVTQLGGFSHPLLRQIRFVGSYEGKSVGPDRRSLTFRTVVGDDARTLVDADTQAFRGQFEKHLIGCGYEIR
ncbi:MAG: phenylalanine--tRNA ligase subunit beta, partial [Planctomycetes bacterium]|nr:phenylalanine--tRNA ligase subunit beta [Planctomycetota bacterium]